ncbi:MAG: ATP-binding cassette domain-containing protein [Spirochaetaceae bacterium]|jgi:zinc transport system ATP-binding protein|nr:ATP-binding cassette domain-containing protein [Spirochaetaceae bacterium]
MLIDCRGVSLGYDGHIVVRDLTFQVDTGDYLCIVGENGSGKSTLVKGILRLLSPLEGTLELSDEIRRNEIGYLSQEAAVRNDFPAGVEEIVLSGSIGAMGLRPFYTRREKQRAEETMERLMIGGLKKRCYRELSGGQQRRVLIARALCASRKLLVLDEPAAGLDPLITAEAYALLKKINQEMGITIIMVSHDIQAALHYANRILHVKNRQVFFGETGDYLNSDAGREYGGLKEACNE